MKYKLKKDLPFAKKGTEVRVTPYSGKTLVLDDPFEKGQVLYVGLFAELPRLILEGWIEEVKPREFDLYFDIGGDLEKIYENDKQIPIDIRKSAPPDYHIIKVREVIE